MSDFHCTVARVESATTHPDENLSHLSIVVALGKNFICSKLENGEHRYNNGDLVLTIPVGAIIPKAYLEFQGFYWDKTKDRGVLGGNQKNRVVTVQRGSVTSDGILIPVEDQGSSRLSGIIKKQNGTELVVITQDYAEEFLEITEYKP
jgi:hypothetical protein